MDNGMATEPGEFKEMVNSCLIAHKSMGEEHRSLTVEEAEMALKMRRSIVCKIDLKSGDQITEDKIEFKRPRSFKLYFIFSYLITRFEIYFANNTSSHLEGHFCFLNS